MKEFTLELIYKESLLEAIMCLYKRFKIVFLLCMIALGLTACEGIHRPVETSKVTAYELPDRQDCVVKNLPSEAIATASQIIDTSDDIEKYYFDKSGEANHVLGIKKVYPFVSYIADDAFYETHDFYKIVTIDLREKVLKYPIGIAITSQDKTLDEVLDSMQIRYEDDFISYINENILFVIDSKSGEVAKINTRSNAIEKVEADDYWIHFYTKDEKLSYDLQKLQFKSKISFETPSTPVLSVDKWTCVDNNAKGTFGAEVQTPIDGVKLGMPATILIENFGNPKHLYLDQNRLFIEYPEFAVRVSYKMDSDCFQLEKVEGVYYSGQKEIAKAKVGMTLSEVEQQFGKISGLHFSNKTKQEKGIVGSSNRNGLCHRYIFNDHLVLEAIELGTIKDVNFYGALTTDDSIEACTPLSIKFAGIQSDDHGYILDGTLYFNGTDINGNRAFYYFNHQLLFPEKIIDGTMSPISAELYGTSPFIVVQDSMTNLLYKVDLRTQKKVQISQFTYDYFSFK